MGIRLTEPENPEESSRVRVDTRGSRRSRKGGSIIARGGLLLRKGVLRVTNIIRAKKSLPPLAEEWVYAPGPHLEHGEYHPFDYIPLDFAATQGATERGFDIWTRGGVRTIDRLLGVYYVEGDSNNIYSVNLRTPHCGCLAFANAPGGRVCKHICAAAKEHYNHNPDLYKEV